MKSNFPAITFIGGATMVGCGVDFGSVGLLYGGLAACAAGCLTWLGKQ